MHAVVNMLRSVIGCRPYRRRLPSHSVVIKVLHPGVVELVHVDMAIVGGVAAALELLPEVLGLRWIRPRECAATFQAHMLSQLNLSNEGHNLDRFTENFRGWAERPTPV